MPSKVRNTHDSYVSSAGPTGAERPAFDDPDVEAHWRRETIVVTGTATGMGRATVDKFAAEGWNVVAAVRKRSDLETHSDLPRVKTLLLDVDDETAAEPFAQLAQEQFGRVDVLVNNAGYYQMGPLEGTSMDQVHRQYQTNVFGLLALTKAFLPSFRAQHAGTVVNIASITGDQGYPYNSVYASSKAAVATLSEALSIELAEFGVVVRAVQPGPPAPPNFTKIDQGDSIPEAYRAGIADFFAGNSPTGSDPSVTAEVIYRAAVDPDPTTVRYYSGPDAVSIPRGKRILGAEAYWQEFRNAVLGHPSDLWNTLMSKPGTTPIDMEL
jgi:NAD(P)-dependent dehydrogenase (short-subunit alcohol dehydrogenase family)